MRKLVLTLAVVALFAAPALATVTVKAEKDAGNQYKVWIKYESNEGQRIRAFALDIVATDGNIIDIDDYAIGDDNGGYGIFPGSFAAAPIQVDPQTGQVVTWSVAGYTPVAPADDPDAKGAIPGPAITIEMGSLYDDSPPSQTAGILCSVTVEDTTQKLCIEANPIRGKVVMEDASEAMSLVLPNGTSSACVEWGECYPSNYPGYDTWLAFGKPDCWCYARNCHGDADGIRLGSSYTGYYYVGTPDLGVLAAAWMVKEPPKAVMPYPNGLVDVPDGICANFDRKIHGSVYTGQYYVGTPDLGILAEAWMAKEPPKNNLAHPYYPNGVPGDCVPVPVEP